MRIETREAAHQVEGCIFVAELCWSREELFYRVVVAGDDRQAFFQSLSRILPASHQSLFAKSAQQVRVIVLSER